MLSERIDKNVSQIGLAGFLIMAGFGIGQWNASNTVEDQVSVIRSRETQIATTEQDDFKALSLNQGTMILQARRGSSQLHALFRMLCRRDWQPECELEFGARAAKEPVASIKIAPVKPIPKL